MKTEKLTAYKICILRRGAILENMYDFEFIYNDTAYTCKIMYPTYTPKELTDTRTKQHTFTGITVKNNKCFVYPYNYMYVTNHAGNDNIYKYEEFSTTNCVFKLYCAVNNGCSVRCVPQNYKGVTDNDDEGIALGKFPTCSWSSDAFTNWLTQQAVNMPTKIMSAIMSTALATVKGGYIGATITAAGNVASIIGEFYAASLLPNVEQGTNTADVTWARGQNSITYRTLRACNEDMQIIDDYFTRYGYAIKRIVTPNITGRTYWNYIEIGETEEIGYGSIPNKYMDEINGACRKGVTIWHSHENIGSWDLNNSIVTQNANT